LPAVIAALGATAARSLLGRTVTISKVRGEILTTEDAPYLGTTFGLPPGVPGGGMTGIVRSPGSGGGRWILGSTSFGGAMTPPDRPSRSLGLPAFGLPASWLQVGDTWQAATLTRTIARDRATRMARRF